jgi:hypothetical protein
MATSWSAQRCLLVVFGGFIALGRVAAGQTAAFVSTIPGTVNVAGLNNTRFVSDLAITNPGSAPVQATLSFLPANGATPRVVSLNAGQTLVYRNLLDSLWGMQGAGATQVASDAPLLVRARTYNAAPTGTFGVALPVFADDRLLAAGRSAQSLWISQSADGSTGYRTNVAVVFPDAAGGAATVTVYDVDGNEIGAQDFSLAAAGFQQFGVGGFAGAVSVARARVLVTRGRAAGYSVVVDNVTGDSSLFTFEELPSGYQDVIVNGVARANGRNNTFFRTDGRFFNPAAEDAVVKASFHASGGSNPSPVSRTFTVGGGRILDVVDVLGSLLNVPIGSAGAVRFETDAPIAILCRTSNVDPLGVKPGTFGAQQKPTPLLSFLMSADAGAVVTGIRQSATFRTNIGFAAGADGATYTLTLTNASGTTVDTRTGFLGAFGWTQPNVADVFAGTTIPDDATLLVKVTSGSVDVFDSSIDNASGDPVVTPIMPLPVSIPSSVTIGPLGGSVRSADGRVTLKVPAGALAGPVAIALTPEVSTVDGALGSAYALTPAVLALAKPALLVFRASAGPALALGLGAVSLAVKTDSGTFVAAGGRIDPAAGTLTVPVSSVSPSGALTTARRVGLDNSKTVIVPANNLVVTPDNPTVLTDGQIALGVVAKFPPSAGDAAEGYLPVLSPLDQQHMTVKWAKPKLGSFDSTTEKIVIYTAPNRINPGKQITSPGAFLSSRAWTIFDTSVTVRFSCCGAAVLRMDLPTTITIVRRNWEMVYSYSIRRKCSDPTDYGLDWDTNGKVSFAIEDQGGLRITGQVLTLGKPTWRTCGACTAIAGSDATGFSGLDAVLQTPSSFDFKTLDISLLAKAAYTTGSATLTGCNTGGNTFSLPVDAQAGFLLFDEPVAILSSEADKLSEGQEVKYLDLATYGVELRYYFRSVDGP